MIPKLQSRMDHYLLLRIIRDYIKVTDGRGTSPVYLKEV